MQGCVGVGKIINCTLFGRLQKLSIKGIKNKQNDFVVRQWKTAIGVGSEDHKSLVVGKNGKNAVGKIDKDKKNFLNF